MITINHRVVSHFFSLIFFLIVNISNIHYSEVIHINMYSQTWLGLTWISYCCKKRWHNSLIPRCTYLYTEIRINIIIKYYYYCPMQSCSEQTQSFFRCKLLKKIGNPSHRRQYPWQNKGHKSWQRLRTGMFPYWNKKKCSLLHRKKRKS